MHYPIGMVAWKAASQWDQELASGYQSGMEEYVGK